MLTFVARIMVTVVPPLYTGCQERKGRHNGQRRKHCGRRAGEMVMCCGSQEIIQKCDDETRGRII